ncbi:hypothetical protein CMI47_21610 [Candidatus Pacearchaeota archaeon]|nr:hypothetical protein [Candidatus Pacearchaeota archaeon]
MPYIWPSLKELLKQLCEICLGFVMPKISRINKKDIDVNGTCYMGSISASYSMLVEKFGHPNTGWDPLTDVEWHIEFEDGSVATIYNWKDGFNYCGEDGSPVEDIKHWHIGGHSPAIESWINDYVLNAWPVFDEVRQEAQY